MSEWKARFSILVLHPRPTCHHITSIIHTQPREFRLSLGDPPSPDNSAQKCLQPRFATAPLGLTTKSGTMRGKIWPFKFPVTVLKVDLSLNRPSFRHNSRNSLDLSLLHNQLYSIVSFDSAPPSLSHSPLSVCSSSLSFRHVSTCLPLQLCRQIGGRRIAAGTILVAVFIPFGCAFCARPPLVHLKGFSTKFHKYFAVRAPPPTSIDNWGVNLFSLRFLQAVL